MFCKVVLGYMVHAEFKETERSNAALQLRIMNGRAVVQITFSGDMTDDEFGETCDAFALAANMPMIIKRPYSLLINTDAVKTRDLSISRVKQFGAVYKAAYDGLKANVDTTIVNMNNALLRTAFNTIMALKRERATDVKLMKSWEECLAFAERS